MTFTPFAAGDALNHNELNTRLTELQTDTTAVATNLSELMDGTDAVTQLKFNDSTLTLSSDSVTVTRSHHKIDTEASAATDNWSTVSGAAEGDILFAQSAATARVVVGVHNTASLFMANEANFVFDDQRHIQLFMYDPDNSRWMEVGRPVGMEKIINYTELSGSAASITLTFTAAYRNLMLVGGFRTDRAAISDDVFIRLNADATAANYGSTGEASSTASAYQEILTTVATAGVMYYAAAGASAPASSFGSFNLTVENALSTSLTRNAYYHGFTRAGTSTAQSGGANGGFWWSNTSTAVSSIVILPRTGPNFVAGSHYTLYGWM